MDIIYILILVNLMSKNSSTSEVEVLYASCPVVFLTE